MFAQVKQFAERQAVIDCFSRALSKSHINCCEKSSANRQSNILSSA